MPLSPSHLCNNLSIFPYLMHSHVRQPKLVLSPSAIVFGTDLFGMMHPAFLLTRKKITTIWIKPFNTLLCCYVVLLCRVMLCCYVVLLSCVVMLTHSDCCASFASVGSTPMMTAFGHFDFITVLTPLINPPPPTGQTTRSTWGKS